MLKFIENLYVKHLNEQVEKYWKIYQFSMEPNHVSHNNEGDAFKHCFMSAELSLLLGYKVAKKLGDKHESWEGNPENELKMDIHNNKEGYKIAESIKKRYKLFFLYNYRDMIAKEIMKLMDAGLLITKP